MLPRRVIQRIISPALFIIALVVLWELACLIFKVPRFILPRPSEIAVIFVARWSTVWPNAAQTVATTLVGFTVGVSIGYALGIALGAFPRLYKTVFPTLVGINSIPKAALVPLFILWAGLGTTPAVFTSAVIVIFPIVVVVSASIATMDPELNDVLRSLGAGRFVVLTKVGIPQTMPYFFGSLRVATSLSFIGTIVAESVAANRGLGYMMTRAASDFDVELVFAGIVTLAAIGICLYCISVIIEQRVNGWAFRRAGAT